MYIPPPCPDYAEAVRQGFVSTNNTSDERELNTSTQQKLPRGWYLCTSPAVHVRIEVQAERPCTSRQTACYLTNGENRPNSAHRVTWNIRVLDVGRTKHVVLSAFRV